MKGGKLTFEARKAITLLSLNKVAKVKSRMVWNPQKGEIPIKIPKAIAADFLKLESLLSKMSSKKNFLKPFFLLF